MVQLLSDDERVDEGTEQDDMLQDARSVRARMGGGGGGNLLEEMAATKEDEDEGMLLFVLADASDVEVELCC